MTSMYKGVEVYGERGEGRGERGEGRGERGEGRGRITLI